jgi:hypothetical protein
MAVKAHAEKHHTLSESSVVGAAPGYLCTACGERSTSLTAINSGAAVTEQNMLALCSCMPSVVDSALIDKPSTFRFAVATFDTGNELRDALQSLRQEGIRDDAFNCLCLEEMMADAALLAVSPATARRTLMFRDQLRPICCTAGPLANRLLARLRAEAPTLKAALGEWLIPRHAEQIQGDVDQGRIVLWVRLLSSEDEPRAYRSLLARSLYSVGVHDLVAE